MKLGQEADRFGRFVMEKFRDPAIDYFDCLARGHWGSASTQSLQAELSAMTPDQLAVVRRSVVAAVDAGLHDFLFALGEAFDLDTGINVIVEKYNIAEQSDGLPGELFSEEGWFARYSKHGQPEENA